jgi:hypothetical protein
VTAWAATVHPAGGGIAAREALWRGRWEVRQREKAEGVRQVADLPASGRNAAITALTGPGPPPQGFDEVSP